MISEFFFSGVPYVTITEPELAWFPDPFFKHAISTQQQMTIMPQNFLRVYRDGRVIFSTRLIILFSCHMDFKRFPHDKQLCPIPIASCEFSDGEFFSLYLGMPHKSISEFN